MAMQPPETRSVAHDPERWGHSLANLGELLTACLDAREAKSVAEVGSYAGELTQPLLDWASRRGARVIAIDPSPRPALVELDESRHDLELIRAPSDQALRQIGLPDAVVIDGDHNYYTVSEELRIVGERATGGDFPLLLFHDVGWPWGRRDTYFDPERIPEAGRQPFATGPRLFPGEPGLAEEGALFPVAAVREGGPRNGVLTAIEDFVDGHPGLRLAVVPAFFGFGVVWDREAHWADAIANVVGPWDRNPLVERLEANRVFHLATSAGRAARPEPTTPRKALTWPEELRCAIDGLIFQIVPEDFAVSRPQLSMDGADFLLVKPRPLIERYVELLDELRPRNIIELGVFEGGGTVFLLELTQPRRLVGIDQSPPGGPALGRYLAQRGLEEVVEIHSGVDQADRDDLGQIVNQAFDGEPLDLVVDDCSHLYGPSRASFNELFPRLRPGGVYVIEDWQWAHEGNADRWPAEVPLTRLVVESILAIPRRRDLVANISVQKGSAQITRGTARMDPRAFDVAEGIDARGRRLLGPEPAP
jgi:predicted O-methyltransferase YrrM